MGRREESPQEPWIFRLHPQKLLSHLSAEDYGRLSEKTVSLPGFFIQKRTVRQYNYTVASNILGNIREVSATTLRKTVIIVRATTPAISAWKKL